MGSPTTQRSTSSSCTHDKTACTYDKTACTYDKTSCTHDRTTAVGLVGLNNSLHDIGQTQGTPSSTCPPPKLGFIPRTAFAFSAEESPGYQKGVRVLSPYKSPVTTQHQRTTSLPTERETQTFSNSQHTTSIHGNTHSPGFSRGHVYGVNSSTSHSNDRHSNGFTELNTSYSHSATQHTNSSTSQHDSTFSRTSSTGDVVYYNHHTEELSGGVFDDTIVFGEEVFPGSEFDCLRSEAALDIQ